jgi:WS/DGAT/MGAT family acyltransferase
MSHGGHVEQLSGLDAAFLAMESATVFGHIGSVTILEPQPGLARLDRQRLAALIASRLHLLKPFRRRLVEVPLGLDQPYWIEDPDFDLDYHVREIALPAPGGDDQLAEQAARLHARPLDRTRPLWEVYLIHGLTGGRQAMYIKIHHAAIDGVSGGDVYATLLDTTPVEAPVDPPTVEWAAETPPHPVALLGRSALTLARQPLRAARVAYGLAGSVTGLATSPARPRLPVIDDLLGRDDVVLPGPALRAPATPFNKPVSAHRRWSFFTLDLADVKQVKNAAGATVNDVVMALVTGGLRTYLLHHDALPGDPLVAAVPVSLRHDGPAGTGNRVSAMLAALPTQAADPADRLRLCTQAMAAAKKQHGALPATLLGDLTAFAMPALAGQAARLAARVRLLERINPFNLFVSNVPGPNLPLYLAGARVLGYYPLSALTEGQGLNVTVCSLDGGMHFGLIADRELMPDLDLLSRAIADELPVLRAAVAPGPAATAARAGSSGKSQP